MPSTFLLTSFYWDNFIYFGSGPKKGPDGVLALTMPMGDKKLPAIAAEDIGACAYGIFKRGSEYIGKTVGIAGEHLSGEAMAAKLTKALGKRGLCRRPQPRRRAELLSGAADLQLGNAVWPARLSCLHLTR